MQYDLTQVRPLSAWKQRRGKEGNARSMEGKSADILAVAGFE